MKCASCDFTRILITRILLQESTVYVNFHEKINLQRFLMSNLFQGTTSSMILVTADNATMVMSIFPCSKFTFWVKYFPVCMSKLCKYSTWSISPSVSQRFYFINQCFIVWVTHRVHIHIAKVQYKAFSGKEYLCSGQILLPPGLCQIW